MSTERIKIRNVIDSFRSGGAETLLINTVSELTEYDHVVVALNKPEDLKDRLPSSTKYYCLNFTFRRANQVSIIMALRKIVKEEKPDVIHAHLYWSIIMARLARPKKVKFIFTLHGMMGSRLFRKKLSPYRILEKITTSQSQHMVAVSKTVYDDYIRYLPFNGTTHIIYNYVPDQYFKNVKSNFAANELFRVVTVGSLREIKNQETIIKAIGLLGPN
jgi:glycosyltransferase involved in cell wall biosynthesis